MTYLGLVSRFSDFWSVVLSIPKTCFSTFTFICILLKKIYTPDKLGLEILTLGRDDSLQAGGMRYYPVEYLTLPREGFAMT